MSRICFFCRVDKAALSVVDFYAQDIKILQGYCDELVIATKWSEIDFSCDLIFVWWWTFAIFPVFWGRLRGVPVLITGTFNFNVPDTDRDYKHRSLLQRFLIRCSYVGATHNILVSQTEFDQLQGLWRKDKPIYIPHGVDIEKYLPGKYGRDDFFFTVLWTGRENIVRKCLYELLDAAKILQGKISERFVIAGRRGDAFEEVLAYIAEKEITNVDLIGEIEEEKKIEYLQRCRFYIQPSKYEGFGLAVAEAMACGAIVITSAKGELPNLVGDAGILLTDDEPATIARAILDGLALDDLSSMHGARARERIVRSFSIKRRRADLTAILRECIEERRKTGAL